MSKILLSHKGIRLYKLFCDLIFSLYSLSCTSFCIRKLGNFKSKVGIYKLISGGDSEVCVNVFHDKCSLVCFYSELIMVEVSHCKSIARLAAILQRITH